VTIRWVRVDYDCILTTGNTHNAQMLSNSTPGHIHLLTFNQATCMPMEHADLLFHGAVDWMDSRLSVNL
jgi:hypothetical protein